jgi:hypothetical protein
VFCQKPAKLVEAHFFERQNTMDYKSMRKDMNRIVRSWAFKHNKPYAIAWSQWFLMYSKRYGRLVRTIDDIPEHEFSNFYRMVVGG